jgi:hypothetical protein
LIVRESLMNWLLLVILAALITILFQRSGDS